MVKFTNTDTVPHSVQSRDANFNSGPIAPGGTWVYTAGAKGTFALVDGTRPYVTGTLQVY